ncbi:hypothetical protein PI124_g18098 [Phytophthora idaei]|nr:hypothetical protein PI125_g18612 [Phytophthora idaei]KAG3137951.1 hypothetical protein PI126_g17137 [Phytophthora idaei]KAG3236902.1 hypothetical protein PI124_g18098 [Phytophthora idaei]
MFRPELPEGLPEKRDIKHRIDVKDANPAMLVAETNKCYQYIWKRS